MVVLVVCENISVGSDVLKEIVWIKLAVSKQKSLTMS